MRKPIIAGNWKLHKTVDESVDLANQLKAALADVKNVEIIVAPVFTALTAVAQAVNGIAIRLSPAPLPAKCPHPC